MHMYVHTHLYVHHTRVTSILTEFVLMIFLSSVGTVLVPDASCSNGTAGPTLDCITNGSLVGAGANQTDGSVRTDDNTSFCTASVASAVYISCANRNRGKRVMYWVHTGANISNY